MVDASMEAIMRKGGFALGLSVAFALLISMARAETGAALYPPPDRAWTKGDYVEFYFAHFNGNHALPHLREAEMRAVFDRLVSADNLVRLVAAPMPEAEKLAELRLMLSALGEIRAAYNISVQAGEPLSEELARVQIFMLAALELAMRISDAAGAAPSRAWDTSIVGVVASLGEHDVYSKAQRGELADALSRQMQSLRFLLSDKSKQRMMDQVGRLAARENDPALRNSLKRLLIAVAEG
jgi:hypothetical protein